MIPGGAAMDLAFIRRTSLQSFSICRSSQSSSPLNSSSVLGVVVCWVIPARQVPALGDQEALTRWWYWSGAMRMSHSDRSKANLRIAGETDRLLAGKGKRCEWDESSTKNHVVTLRRIIHIYIYIVDILWYLRCTYRYSWKKQRLKLTLRSPADMIFIPPFSDGVMGHHGSLMVAQVLLANILQRVLRKERRSFRRNFWRSWQSLGDPWGCWKRGLWCASYSREREKQSWDGWIQEKRLLQRPDARSWQVSSSESGSRKGQKGRTFLEGVQGTACQEATKVGWCKRQSRISSRGQLHQPDCLEACSSCTQDVARKCIANSTQVSIRTVLQRNHVERHEGDHRKENCLIPEGSFEESCWRLGRPKWWSEVRLQRDSGKRQWEICCWNQNFQRLRCVSQFCAESKWGLQREPGGSETRRSSEKHRSNHQRSWNQSQGEGQAGEEAYGVADEVGELFERPWIPPDSSGKSRNPVSTCFNMFAANPMFADLPMSNSHYQREVQRG